MSWPLVIVTAIAGLVSGVDDVALEGADVVVARTQAAPPAVAPPPPAFLSDRAVLGARITCSGSASRLAVLDDLVIDLRDGRTRFAVISTNGIRGSAKRQIALPYGVLSWDDPAQLFTVDVTAEELDSLPPFEAEKLGRMQATSWMGTLRGIFGNRSELEPSTSSGADEYTRLFDGREPVVLSGAVVEVERHARTMLGGASYALVLHDARTDAPFKVLLGPVAWLARHDLVPAVGETVRVTGARGCDADGGLVYVAGSVERGDSRLNLRTDDGMPAWAGGAARNEMVYLALASSLVDRTVLSRGETVGRLEELVFEVRSGSPAFALVSARALLGSSELRVPMPWEEIAVAARDAAYVDLRMPDIKAAPRVGDDVSMHFGRAGFVGAIYDHFGLRRRAFETDRSARWFVVASGGGAATKDDGGARQSPVDPPR